jgi:hypothetical protein
LDERRWHPRLAAALARLDARTSRETRRASAAAKRVFHCEEPATWAIFTEDLAAKERKSRKTGIGPF